jgi:peptide/nickel transport system permease protein
MGTASGQWDIYYGVIWGTRTALFAGLTITFVGVIIGVTLGAISAYHGGWVDMVLMRITDLFQLSLLLTAMTLSAVLTPRLGKGLLAPMVALIVFSWMGFARLLRSEFFRCGSENTSWRRAVIGVGQPDSVRHILPNAIFHPSTGFHADWRYAITFAGLSFLGIGAEVGFADWGQLLSSPATG